ncbi:hypothetical protein FRC06_001715 [Ceratobasidium sp. 370]|nr:hypothetical protein FRC06_001715 [Ceratobasidium sp. 370]
MALTVHVVDTAQGGINTQARSVRGTQPTLASLCLNIVMKFLVSTTLLSAIAVSAVPSLVLDVVGPSSVVDVHNLSVKATLKNTGDETLKLLNDPRTVLSTAATDTFRIFSESGSPTFTGIKLKYVPSKDIALNEEGTFTVLAPGQSVEITHDLAGVYDFTLSGEGAYRFSASNVFNYLDATGALKTIQAGTNIYKFKLMGRLTTKSGYTPTFLKRDVTYTNCSATQQADIAAAATASNDYVSAATAYLAGISANTTTERYTTWFGNFTTARHATVVDHFQKIGTDATSTDYDCVTCIRTRGTRYNGTFAYVISDEPGKIYLCGAFWRAPLTGEDSRAGTIVHENSHFDVNGGTDDLAYGQTLAKELAESNPDDAIRNADSHEYFAENDPALP